MPKSTKTLLTIFGVLLVGHSTYLYFNGRGQAIWIWQDIRLTLWVVIMVWLLLQAKKFIVSKVQGAKLKLNEYENKGRAQYEDLPPLGKIRIDEKASKVKWEAKVIGGLGLVIVSFVINPIVGVMTSIGVYNYLKGAKRERDSESKENAEERAKTLSA